MIQLIKPTEAAALLCISDLTLRKWRWEGKGPRFIKVGRNVAYRKEDLDAFINGQVRRSTSDTGENL